MRLKLDDLDVVDSFTFLGPVEIPAMVSLDVTFVPTGKMRHIRPASSDPTDPHNWAGQFRDALATGTFSGSGGGFSFSGSGTSASVFAEMGTQHNGFFVRSVK